MILALSAPNPTAILHILNHFPVDPQLIRSLPAVHCAALSPRPNWLPGASNGESND